MCNAPRSFHSLVPRTRAETTQEGLQPSFPRGLGAGRRHCSGACRQGSAALNTKLLPHRSRSILMLVHGRRSWLGWIKAESGEWHEHDHVCLPVGPAASGRDLRSPGFRHLGLALGGPPRCGLISMGRPLAWELQPTSSTFWRSASSAPLGSYCRSALCSRLPTCRR